MVSHSHHPRMDSEQSVDNTLQPDCAVPPMHIHRCAFTKPAALRCALPAPQASKPPASVSYSQPMPDIEELMAEWPPEMEGALRNMRLPQGDMVRRTLQRSSALLSRYYCCSC